MSTSSATSARQVALGLVIVLVLSALLLAVVYGLSRVMTGAVGGATAGGIVAVIVALISKRFELQKHRDVALAEKKREVYRRLLTPWERILADLKNSKQGEDVVANVDFAALYASSFDAVLYGSEDVVKRYADFRAPESDLDPLDRIRALATLLIEMRRDITGKPSELPAETVLRMFVNLTSEQLVALRLRDYVSKNPQAQQQLRDVLKETPQSAPPAR